MVISDCALATTTLFTEKLNRKLKNILNQTCKDKISLQPFPTMFCILFPILINIFKNTQTAEYCSV